MAAPSFVPSGPVDDARAYRSPGHVPGAWMADRPAELGGRQPSGTRFGSQGPDQGFGLKLANRFRDRIVVTPGESADDAVRGCLNVALRRSSMYGRAPMVHDLTLAFTIFGYLDADAPAELVAHRRRAFEGVANAAHHYAEGRAVVDAVPEATFRLTPEQASGAYRTGWRGLIGA